MMTATPTEIKMKIVVDTSELVAATERMKEYIVLKSLAGFDTSADLAAMTAIIMEAIGEETDIPQTGGRDGRGDRTGDDAGRGWERISPAEGIALH